MARSDGFVVHVLELLEPLGLATSRSMFGGHGVYLDGLIVGLIVEGRLYLKVDDETKAAFEAAGGEPFRYAGRGDEVVVMSYWTPPVAALDSLEELAPWARRAREASQRALAGKVAKARRPAAKKPPVKKKSPAKKPKPAK